MEPPVAPERLGRKCPGEMQSADIRVHVTSIYIEARAVPGAQDGRGG